MAKKAMNTSADRSSWPDLPSELLELIAERLKFKEDKQQLRFVCKSWHYSWSVSKYKNCVGPFLVRRMELTRVKRLFPSIVSTSVYILCRGIDDARWLVGVQHLNQHKYRLVHPLTYRKIKSMNRFLDKSLPETSNFIPLRISTFITHSGKDISTESKSIYWENPKASYATQNFIVTLNEYNAVSLRVIRDKKYNNRKFTYGRKVFTDIAKWKNRVWAVDNYGRVYGIDYKTANVTTILAACTDMKDGYEARKRLFESNGNLYMVVRKTVRRDKIQVYVLNAIRDSWEKVRRLGDDRILFVSYDSCFFAMVNDLAPPGSLSGNCIVLTSDCFSMISGEYNPSLSTNQGEDPCFQPIVAYEYGKSSVYKDSAALAALFWPPPTWIWKDR